MPHDNHILLLEDDAVDVMTIKRVMKQLDFSQPIVVATNGEEGLDQLSAHAKLPSLILLDINMPKMNGLEFLQIIKRHEVYRRIPVVVLTTSQDPHDKLESFNHSVAGYMIKPMNFQRFKDMMATLKAYWTLSELAY